MGVLKRIVIAQLLTWMILNDEKIPRNTFALACCYPNEHGAIGTTPAEENKLIRSMFVYELVDRTGF
jgi:hypothetical protein